jgi:hypothetical protein
MGFQEARSATRILLAMATDPSHRPPLLAGFATLIVLGAGLASPARVDAGAHACQAGVRKVAGVSEETFCGPATAKVEVGGKTLSFSQGNCVKTNNYVSINIGTVSLSQSARHQPNYFGLDIGKIPGSNSPPARKDGSYRSGTVLTLEYANTSYDVLTGVATLKGNRSRGTVRGKTVTGQLLTGTFIC